MKHTNQLIHSQSPYLLQHAHNPVNWFMWSDEVLEKARQENKPILVSIGYSSCHWCHVMERESFEDEATASVMNEHFINIKIDREERPDLDHIYMDAVQAMTGSGGWPLNVFLLPNLKPFYGGTYFPPIAAHGRLSWTDILFAVSNAFNERKDEIELQADKLTTHINNSNAFTKSKVVNEKDFTQETLNIIAKNLLQNADEIWGGFGNAPKFPQTFSIQFLLRHYHFTKDEKALQQATLSLDKMIMGGLYDHIGGGFARYSTDEKWFAPHFEKMLYDNALLVGVLSEAYQVTKNELYKETIEQTLAFIEREMMSDEFGFYSALDADSEGMEGKFYTWSKTEIENILNEETELFCNIFNVKENGNWEHTNIIWLQKQIEEFAIDEKINVKSLKTKIGEWKAILLQERNKRIRPLLDDKVLCSWNALMNVAYSKAYAATGNNHYKEIAIKNAAFILSKLFSGEQLMHCYKSNAYNNAFLDDYAYLIEALIHLQEITGEISYLLNAKKMLKFVIENFSNEDENFFYYTSPHHQNLIAKKVEVYDSATASANAVLCKCLHYLSVVFDDDKMRKRYRKMLYQLAKAVIQYPTSFGFWAMCIQNEVEGLNEIVAITDADLETVLKLNNKYLPNKILVFDTGENINKIAVLNDKFTDVKPQFFICKKYRCQQPQNDISKFLLFYNI